VTFAYYEEIAGQWQGLLVRGATSTAAMIMQLGHLVEGNRESE
jgi:hypothetical protein